MPGSDAARRGGLALIWISVLGLVWLGWTGAARAQEATKPSAATGSRATANRLVDRLRGSALQYRNVASAASFDRALGRTYDPYYAMAIEVRPQLWLNEAIYVNAALDLTAELTHSGETTMAREALWGDLQLTVGAPAVGRIPGLGVDLSADLGATLPTSKVARFRTLETAVTGTVSLSRTFDLLGGLTAQTGLGATRFFHRFTTSENAGGRYPGCGGVVLGARAAGSSCLNTGVRNPQTRTVISAGLLLAFGPRLRLALSGVLVHDFLYAQGPAVIDAAPSAGGGPGVRYAMGTAAELVATPRPGVALALGVSTQTEQLHSRPDVVFRDPLFDPYRTTIFFDVRLDVAKPATPTRAR